MNSRSIRIKALKTLDSAVGLRGLASIRKALIDAQKSAILAGDDLEDMLYSPASSMQEAVQYGPALEDAVQAVKEIEEHIKAAIELSQHAKAALRVNTGSMLGEQPTEPSNVTEAKSAQRRLAMRRAIRNRRGY